VTMIIAYFSPHDTTGISTVSWARSVPPQKMHTILDGILDHKPPTQTLIWASFLLLLLYKGLGLNWLVLLDTWHASSCQTDLGFEM
jgi:hypothetical protein